LPAQIALREETLLIRWTRALGGASRQCLSRLLSNYPGPFDPDPSCGLALAFPRYRGAEGSAAFDSRLAIKTGTLPPAILWRLLLGTMPDDRLRISLGQLDVPARIEGSAALLEIRKAA
jgi:hypothetical protein